MANRNCKVRLTNEERDKLEALLKSGKVDQTKEKRIWALLKLNMNDPSGGWEVSKISKVYGIRGIVVATTYRRYREGGLEEAINRKKSGFYPQKVMNSDVRNHLAALCSSEPPEGHKSWTLKSLRDKLIEMEVVEYVSRQTIGVYLKRMGISLREDINDAVIQEQLAVLLRSNPPRNYPRWTISLLHERLEKLKIAEHLPISVVHKALKKMGVNIGRVVNSKVDEELRKLFRSKPPEGYKHWTSQLLCDHLIQRKAVYNISTGTVQKTLRRLGLQLHRKRRSKKELAEIKKTKIKKTKIQKTKIQKTVTSTEAQKIITPPVTYTKRKLPPRPRKIY